MSDWLLEQPGGYRDRTNALLDEFGLQVPDKVTLVLARRIMFERFKADIEARSLNEIVKLGRWGTNAKKALEQRKKGKEAALAEQTPTSKKKRERLSERVASAINQTNALLNKKGDQTKHRRNLQKALSNTRLVVELALADPPCNAIHILDALDDQSVSKNSLHDLMASLVAVRDSPPAKTGRPKDNLSEIVTAASEVWKAAGKSVEFSCHYEVLSGPFAEFLMAVFKACGIPQPKGKDITALYQRLRSMQPQ